MRDVGTPPRPRIGWAQLWGWAAPWLFIAVLAAMALLGLFTASRAETTAASSIGFGTAGLAVLLLAWGIRRAADRAPLVPLPLLVDDPAALVVLIALLAVLAIAGLLLAARSADALAVCVGYALFAVALVFIFGNLKHYFDRRDRTRR